MKHVVEMASGAMIYISSSIQIGSALQNLIGRGNRHTHRQHGDSYKPTFIFSKLGQ
jgi:hypothetical protein